jgi:hypothetical protein
MRTILANVKECEVLRLPICLANYILNEHYTFHNSKILPLAHFIGSETGDVDPENALRKPPVILKNHF